MNYVAWLPAETVAACIEANLFDIPENRTMLRKMLGLESHKPTDCVGTVSEAGLAFAMCRAKGVGGIIADDIDVSILHAEAAETLDHYAPAARPGRTYPPRLVEPMDTQFQQQADRAKSLALEILRGR
jgi:hypothetical protein